MSLKSLSGLKIGDYTLPTSDGTNGQVLQTDGSGNVTFQSVSISDKFTSGLSFDTSTGVLTATVANGSNVTVDLDGRFVPLSGGSGSGQAMTGNLHIQTPGPIIYLKDTSDDDDQNIIFQNNAGTNEYRIATQDFTGGGGGDGFYIGSLTSDGEVALVTNTTTALTLDTSQNATFANDIETPGTINLPGNGNTATREILINAHGTRAKLMKEGNAAYWQVAQGSNQFEITDAANGNSTKGNVLLRTNGHDDYDNKLILVPNGGTVGINTPVPFTANASADELVVGSGSGNQGMTIYSGDSNSGSIYFADDLDEEGAGDSPAGNRDGVIQYSHSNSEFNFKTGGNQQALELKHTGATFVSNILAGNNVYAAGNEGFVFGSSTSEGEYIKRSGNDILFYSGGSEKVRITSNQLILQGSSSTEGAEIKMAISTSGQTFHIDNHSGNLRVHTLASGKYLQIVGADGTGTKLYGNKIESNGFYDANSTSYYVDPASSSNMDHIQMVTGSASLKFAVGVTFNNSSYTFYNEGTSYLKGNVTTNGNISVGNDLYVPNEIYHTGDTDTYLQFPAADQFRINTGGGNRLQVQNDKILVGDDVNMQYDGISTGNSGTVVYGGFLNPASEANMVHIPHIINDLAGFNKWSNATITTSGFYQTRSGSAGSYTYSNEVSSSTAGWANAFDAHSSTAGSWYSDNGSDGVYTHGTDTPGVVELQWTNEATYSLWAGIVFGSGSFTATYVKIEAYRGGAWQTLCEITNNTDQVILRQVGSNSGTGAATTRLKYTLGGSVNNSYFRIHSLYMANYRAGDNNLNNTSIDSTRGVNFLERYKNNYAHGHFYPGANNTYDIGSSSYKWNNVNAVTLNGNLVGTIHSNTTANTQSQGNNSTKVATTAYVDTAVTNLVDSAPGTLNTLNELAAALGDDANFSTTVTNNIAGKVSKSGDTMTGSLTIGSDASGHDFLVYGSATGEKMLWDTSESRLVINHDTDDFGVGIFTVGSAQMTQPQLKIGRDASQYWGVYTDDRNAHLVHRQDETSGIMTTRFDQWDSNTSDNTGQWQWRSGNGTGGSMTTAAVLYQDGDFTVGGDLMPISDGGGSLGGGSGINLRWSGLELQSGAGIQWQNGDARIVEGLVNNYSLSLQTYDGSALSTALRLDGDNNANFAGDVSLADSKVIKLGSGGTFQLWHQSGTNGNSFIDEQSTGELYIRSNSTIRLAHYANNTATANFNPAGAVELYHNTALKFKTEAAGASVTGNFYLTSGNHIHFDNGGSNNYYVRKTGTTLEFKTGGSYNFLSGDATFAGETQAPKFTAAQGTTYANGYRLTRTGHDTYRIGLGNSEGLRIINETDSSREELAFDGAGNATFAGGLTIGGVLDGVTNMFLGEYLYHQGDGDTYLNFQNANEFRIVVGGSEKLHFNTARARINQHLYVAADSSYDLGQNATRFRTLYVDDIDGGNSKLLTSDASNYFRINTSGGSAQLGLFRTTSGTIGGGYIGIDVNKFRIYNDSFSEKFSVGISTGDVNTKGHIILPSGKYLEFSGQGKLVNMDVTSWSNASEHNLLYSGWESSIGDYLSFKVPGNSTTNHGNLIIGDNGLWFGRMNATDSAQATDSNTNPHSGSGSNYFRVNTAGDMQVSGSVISPIYYDTSGTTYYLDLGNTSTSLNVPGSINLLDNKMLLWGGNSIIKHTGSATQIGDNSSGSVLTIASGDADFTGNVEMQSGNSVGKFAVMSTAPHGSYDFYNNGTSYFNGAVTIDDNLSFTGDDRILSLAGGTTNSQSRVIIGEQGVYGVSFRWNSGSDLEFDGFWNSSVTGSRNRDLGSVDVNNRRWNFENTVVVGGSVTAGSFVKSGGTSSQFLMADGSVSTGGGGTIDGSGAANRLAIWSDSDTLTSNVNIAVSSGQLNLGNGLLVEDNDTTVITAKAYEPHIVWQKTRGSSGDDFFKIKAENDAMVVDFTTARDGGSDTRVLRIDNNNKFIFSPDGQYNVLHTSLMSVYGRLTSSSDIRSTQYYDYNDTTKYIDLNNTGTSLVANGTATFGGTGTSSFGGDLRLESGTSGTTAKLIFKTTDNTDTSKFIRTNAYWNEYGAHRNEGHKFIDSNSNILLQLNGDNSTTGNGALSATFRGDIYGKSVNNAYSQLYKFGGIFFTWDSDSYGTNFNHSITSTDNGTYSDSLTINSFDKVRINIDSNSNDSASTFSIGKQTTGTGNELLTLAESGNLTIHSGSVTVGSNTVINTARQGFFASLQHSGVISFLDGSQGTTGSGAQGINVRHLFASGSYNTTPGQGDVWATSDMRAPIFYDYDNTSYYLNPASTSILNSVTLSSFNMDGNTISGIDDSGEFTDNDAHIMTSAAVRDKFGFAYFTAGSGDYDTFIRGVQRGQGGSNGPSGTTHATGFTLLQDDNNYGFQLFSTGSGDNTEKLFYRYKGTSYENWQTIVTKTFGDGRYLKLSGGQVSGNLTVTGTFNAGRTTIESASDNILTLNQTGTDTGWNYIDFKTAGDRKWFIGMDSNKNFDLYNDNINAYAITVDYATNAIALLDDVSITGNLTVNGTTTTVNQTNLDVSDNIIGLNRGASSNANDSGLIIERGSTGDNAAFLWDETADKFIFGTTTGTPASTGNVTFAPAPFGGKGLWTTTSAVTHWGPGVDGTAYGTLTWDTGYAAVHANGSNVLRLGSGSDTDAVIIDGSDMSIAGDLTVNGTDGIKVQRGGGTGNAIRLLTENDGSQIADSFSANTSKSYIYFDARSSSNDPGYIMHETSSTEANEGVLHLVPSDDNSTGDYVSIHGTNDPDVLKLHTSGLVETVNLQLQLKSGLNQIYLNDDILVAGASTFSSNVHIDGTSGSSGNAFSVDRGSDGAIAFRVQNSGEVVTSANYFYAAASGTSMYVQNTAVFRGGIINDSADAPVLINDSLKVNVDLEVAGGDITLGGTGRIQGVDTVSASTDAANKDYVDNAVSGLATADTTYEFNFSTQLTANTWTDTGIDGTDMATGTYIMRVEVSDHNLGGQHYDEAYSATISWFTGATNSTFHDEIVVHRAGHAPNNGDVQFRTLRASGSDTHDLMLQVKHNQSYSAAPDQTSGKTFKFKFRKMI